MIVGRFILLICCLGSTLGGAVWGQELELVDNFHFEAEIEHYTLSPLGYVGYFFSEVDEQTQTSNRHFIVRDLNYTDYTANPNDIMEDAVVFRADDLMPHNFTMAVLDGSSQLVFVSDPSKYSLYDLAVSEGRRNWQDDDIAAPVSSLILSEFLLAIAHGMPDAVITVRDLETEEVLATLTGHTDFISKIAIAPDNNTLASMSDDGTVKIWQIQQGKRVASFDVYASDIAISADNSTLIIKESDWVSRIGDIILVDLSTLTVTERITGVYADAIYTDAGADISPAGSLLAASHEVITVLDVASGEILTQTYPYAPAATISPIYDVMVSADNQFLVVAKRDGIDIWRWADASPILP